MLDPESIQIWCVALSGSSSHGALYSAPQIEAWRAMLSPEEQRRADAFHGEGHRRDYVIAHVALRSVLGQCLRLAPDQVRFAAGSFEGGGMPGQVAGRIKPALPRGSLKDQENTQDRSIAGGTVDIRFNLSHTRGMALIGVAVGRELGVDIEFQRPMEDLDAMARSVMSGQELERWLTIREADREQAFYRLWTRKEAYLKAIGLGLYRSLQEITVPVTAADLERDAIHLVRDRAGEGSWQLQEIAVESAYAAAVCFEGEEPVGLVVHHLDLLAIR